MKSQNTPKKIQKNWYFRMCEEKNPKKSIDQCPPFSILGLSCDEILVSNHD
mgnify:CR=1 FL=1